MTVIRAFFALGVSALQQRQLAQVTQHIASEQVLPRALGSGESLMRWVPPENYHITLAFLGNIRSDDISRLNDVALQLTPQFSAMLLCFNTVTWFPKPEKPKILVTLPKPFKALMQLQSQLSQSLRALKYYQESTPFNPHITLARTNKKCKMDVKGASYFQEHAIDMTLTINRLALFSSLPGDGGPVYTPLFTHRLGV